ncbi:hypothetical protein F4779DRAFT_588520 [Xylariaceae sp. FL0662B]|nr:hypothetical protein F4779DRAFT_588520 [Xylariaceae sp. FL0662B]
MKLQGFLLPALAGIATANSEGQQNTEAYIIRQSKASTSNPPSIPNDLAEAILLQRLSSPEQPSALGKLSESISEDEAVSYINQFGKPSRPLFEETDANEPSQLVIAFSGVTADKYKELKAALPQVPLAFTAPKLNRLPIGRKPNCAFGSLIDPKSDKCWKGKAQYLRYDAAKDSDVITQLKQSLASLNAQALDGTLETTILLPAPTTGSESASEELRRRDMAEQVIAEDPGVDTASKLASTNPNTAKKPIQAFASRPADLSVPACFASESACMNETDSCSGHGECVNKWAKNGGDNNACFACRCLSTTEEAGDGRKSLYHWGGAMCHKRDVSTPFWLFAGVTVGLASAVAFSISLLFGVGEEKLPGVIGAGVSRSK